MHRFPPRSRRSAASSRSVLRYRFTVAMVGVFDDGAVESIDHGGIYVAA